MPTPLGMGSIGPPTSVPPSPAAAPGLPSPVHELRTLVLSRHPAIAVESSEEERVDVLLGAVAAGARLAHFQWTVTRGLVRMGGEAPVYGSEDPAQALAAIGEMAPDALYVLKDFAAHLQAPATSRAFRELLKRFAAPGRTSTVVLVGARVELAPEVAPHVVRYELPLPGRDEYRRTVAAVVESLRMAGRARVEIGHGDVDGFADALAGLTLNQARQAVARVAIEDGCLARDDLARVVELKAQALREDALLEYFPAADNPARLGGFAGLQRWLARARVGFSDRAAELNLPAPQRRAARRRAGLRQVAGRQGDRASAGSCRCSSSTPVACTTSSWASPSATCARRSPPPRRWRRWSCGSTRSRRASPSGGAATADGGLSQRLFGTLPDLDAGEARRGLRGRDRQRHVGAAAGAAAQGPLRRDLLRRPARRRRAGGDPAHPPASCAARTRRRSTSPQAWRRPATASAARRSSRR